MGDVLFCALPSFIQQDLDGDHYGTALCTVGDVDRDGVSDFAVGETACGDRHPIIDLRSGATGKLIWRIGALSTDAVESKLAAAGDVDRDGTPDLLYSTPWWTLPEGQSGTVRVLSGRDGHVLWAIRDAREDSRFGRAIAGNVDFDGDGTPDILIGSPGSELRPRAGAHVCVYSGVTAALLLDIEGAFGSGVGGLIAAGADFDDDCVPDIVTCTTEGLGTPHLAVLSGKDGHTIQNIAHAHARPEHENEHRIVGCVQVVADNSLQSPRVVLSCLDWASEGHSFAHEYGIGSAFPFRTIRSVDPAGDCGIAMTTESDVDGDGVKDIVLGAPESQTAGFCAGEVTAWSGATGRLLWRVFGGADQDLGATLAGGLDVDGDCCQDVLAGAVWINGGGIRSHVYVISGRTGEVIRTLERDSP